MARPRTYDEISAVLEADRIRLEETERRMVTGEPHPVQARLREMLDSYAQGIMPPRERAGEAMLGWLHVNFSHAKNSGYSCPSASLGHSPGDLTPLEVSEAKILQRTCKCVHCGVAIRWSPR